MSESQSLLAEMEAMKNQGSKVRFYHFVNIMKYLARNIFITHMISNNG